QKRRARRERDQQDRQCVTKYPSVRGPCPQIRHRDSLASVLTDHNRLRSRLQMAGSAGTLIRLSMQAFGHLISLAACSTFASIVRELQAATLVRGARRSRNSRKNSSGGTKNGFSSTMPPMRIIGWVRMTSMIRLPPHLVRL